MEKHKDSSFHNVDEANLVDISISNDGQNAIMAIEANSIKENYFFVFVLIILTSIISISIYHRGPQPYFESYYNHFKSPFQQLLQGFSSNSPFLSLFLYFTDQDNFKKSNKNISLSCFALLRQDFQEIQNKTFFINRSMNSFPLLPHSNVLKVPIFYDKKLKYNSILMRITSLNNFTYSDGYLVWKIGNYVYLLFQFCLRSIFIIFFGGSIYFFYSSFKQNKIKSWFIEQKLTMFLQFFALIGNNPFYFSLLISYNKFFIILNHLFYLLFQSFIIFYILSIIDIVRLGNNKNQIQILLPKFIFSLFYFIISFLNTIFHDIEGNETIKLSRLSFILSIIHISCVIIIIILFLIRSIIDFISLHSIELHISIFYTLSFIVVIISDIMSIVFNKLSSYQNSSLPFILSYSSKNLFCLLMTFSHYSYQLKQDITTYQEADDSTQNDFSDNGLFDENDSK